MLNIYMSIGPLPPAAKTLFVKRVLDSQKLFIRVDMPLFSWYYLMLNSIVYINSVK
jgi:hypothetical protein